MQTRLRIRVAAFIGAALAISSSAAAADARGAADDIAAILRRLESLETQNRGFAQQIAALERRNAELQASLQDSLAAPATIATPAPTASKPGAVSAAGTSGTAAASVPGAAPMLTTAASLDWLSRVRIAGDFRYRHENIDDEQAAGERTRETLRARIAAGLQITDRIDGEIGISTGGPDPRGSNSVLGAASSRKPLGLDVGYVRWRPREDLAVIGGKMRQPFVRPGMSLFVDNEIRPEGIAVTYDGAGGMFGSAFHNWLEERPASADSTLLGGQLGWAGGTDALRIKVGAGYYDYGSVQGQSPDFADGLVNEFGNSVTGSGADAVYTYDYDIGQLFTDATLSASGIPINVFLDYAHNFAADNGLTEAYSVGVLVGKASAPGRWEFGVMRQAIEKDSLFGHWLDSDFGGGVTDNEGQLYRVAWMPMQSVLLNLIYIDTTYNVDVGNESDYDRWQLDLNFTF
jgi:hypothetical protein